ncbi:hypothetical protein E7T06_18375 [Deinococcus sp. Arct2-2]|uniref:hypothetical protein n=1 Tax=Deinococcus sp. Arct2-2 TaxID=2568653 RepID=UPI0010A39BD5|nr:hypothetical protein [Deinococcus sp. Arct2-2]THF68006.1 hypothetical protein E7T06_18375 [Deinococcus sp. Arct2-2]
MGAVGWSGPSTDATATFGPTFTGSLSLWVVLAFVCPVLLVIVRFRQVTWAWWALGMGGLALLFWERV